MKFIYKLTFLFLSVLYYLKAGDKKYALIQFQQNTDLKYFVISNAGDVKKNLEVRVKDLSNEKKCPFSFEAFMSNYGGLFSYKESPFPGQRYSYNLIHESYSNKELIGIRFFTKNELADVFQYMKEEKDNPKNPFPQFHNFVDEKSSLKEGGFVLKKVWDNDKIFSKNFVIENKVKTTKDVDPQTKNKKKDKKKKGGKGKKGGEDFLSKKLNISNKKFICGAVIVVGALLVLLISYIYENKDEKKSKGFFSKKTKFKKKE